MCDAVVKIMCVVWILHHSSRSVLSALFCGRQNCVYCKAMSDSGEMQSRTRQHLPCKNQKEVLRRNRCYEGIVVTYGEYMQLLSGRSMIKDVFH